MLIDDVMPIYHFREFHTVTIHGSGSDIYRAARNFRFSDAPRISALFRLRGIPKIVTGMQQLERMGFVWLDERPGEEFLLGLVGKFWTLQGAISPTTAKEFSLFDKKGYAKAVWNFSIQAIDRETSRLSTETRIRCTDEKSRRRFFSYWLIIRPFSGTIRKSILRTVKRHIEQRPNPFLGG